MPRHPRAVRHLPRQQPLPGACPPATCHLATSYLSPVPVTPTCHLSYVTPRMTTPRSCPPSTRLASPPTSYLSRLTSHLKALHWKAFTSHPSPPAHPSPSPLTPSSSRSSTSTRTSPSSWPGPCSTTSLVPPSPPPLLFFLLLLHLLLLVLPNISNAPVGTKYDELRRGDKEWKKRTTAERQVPSPGHLPPATCLLPHVT